ncbi:MAG: alpha-L-fucosidase [Oscillospiraceae bacterium]|nr:alpha-L-fucosidase [Oscillospiraceae bacterium]MBR2889982.1 alpha-L-fucosidase [Oscillospiraceae bacterium]
MTQEAYLQEIERVISDGPYKASWASLTGHRTPEWYTRGKLGIFIHWGIYAVPALGNEWYARNMYNPQRREYQYHLEHFGDPKTFGYKDFIPRFKGERFDAREWVKLFSSAGARFILPVAEHHDGFAMYDTAFNRWNSLKLGPERDVMGELKQAAEDAGLKFCASSHRAEHYFFMNMGRAIDSDVNDPAYADLYGPAVYLPEFTPDHLEQTTENPSNPGPTEEWLTDWMVRTCEFIDRYQPKVLYFDWWIKNYAFKPYLKKIAAYYYNRAIQWGEEVTINYKWDAFPPGVATFDVERGALTGISPVPWQTCTAIGKNSWGYTRENRFKSSRQIICDLIDIVSKNGILLLNVGPRADGTITAEESTVLLELGAWLSRCGEGIYDTVPWKTFGEGSVNAEEGFFMDSEEKGYTPEDFRFTYKNGSVYAFQLCPDGRDITLRSLPGHPFADPGIEAVRLLGSDDDISWTRDKEGLHLQVPSGTETDFPLCFRIDLM